MAEFLVDLHPEDRWKRKITKTEQWGVKSLAYRLRKNRKAHFTFMNIDAPPAVINEIAGVDEAGIGAVEHFDAAAEVKLMGVGDALKIQIDLVHLPAKIVKVILVPVGD